MTNKEKNEKLGLSLDDKNVTHAVNVTGIMNGTLICDAYAEKQSVLMQAMVKCFNKIKWMNKLIIFLNICIIKFYKYFISPLLGSRCRYFPTCSEYYIDSLKSHGFIKGSLLGIKRIFSCHPIKFLGGGSGLDLVPNKKDLNKEKFNG